MPNYLSEGKNRGTLSPLEVKNEDNYFVNESIDNFSIAQSSLRRSVFINISLKEAVITDCDFSYSIFINCYFRGAKFRGCNFTGCKFIEVNFRGATLVDCKLIYTKWKETYIKKESVLSNIPSAPNLAQDLLINLRMNSTSIGEFDDSKYYLNESEKFSRQHSWYIVTHYSDYYKKYTFFQRIKSFIELIRSHLDLRLWGYGERPFALSINGALSVAIFALIFLFKEPSHFGLGTQQPSLINSAIDAIKLSILTFSGNTPSTLPDEVFDRIGYLLTLESLLGVVFIAFLAASLHRKISTRRD